MQIVDRMAGYLSLLLDSSGHTEAVSSNAAKLQYHDQNVTNSCVQKESLDNCTYCYLCITLRRGPAM